MQIGWSDQKPKCRKPTRKERGLYTRQRKYLKRSKLSVDEQHRRAAAFTEQGKTP